MMSSGISIWPPALRRKVSPHGVFELSTAQGPMLLTIEPTIAGVVEDSWYSPSYGVRVPSRSLALGCRSGDRRHGCMALRDRPSRRRGGVARFQDGLEIHAGASA